MDHFLSVCNATLPHVIASSASVLWWLRGASDGLDLNYGVCVCGFKIVMGTASGHRVLLLWTMIILHAHHCIGNMGITARLVDVFVIVGQCYNSVCSRVYVCVRACMHACVCVCACACTCISRQAVLCHCVPFKFLERPASVTDASTAPY